MPDIVKTLDGFTYRMEGLADIERMLSELTSDMRRRVVRQALRDASRPIVRAAKQFAAPRDYSSKRRVAGTLRKAISTFNSKRYKGQSGVLGVYVTVKASKAQKRARPISGDPFYWRFVEGGHKIVPRAKGKKSGFKLIGRGRLTGISQRRREATKSVKAYPFLGPAFQAQGDQARRLFEQRIIERIAKANTRK